MSKKQGNKVGMIA